MKPPIIIGIAGGTGAGKTTIARRLAEPLPLLRRAPNGSVIAFPLQVPCQRV
jgi:ABC-type glutathione transport system ATPase component